MEQLEEIRRPIEHELDLYDQFVRSALKSDSAELDEILDYVSANRGKGIRPILVLLSAAIHSRFDSLSKRTYLAALLVEMIHTASLAHDDVIDSSQMRHGVASLNARWDAHIAVLTGDYILAHIFRLGLESGQYDIVQYTIRSMDTLCEGEIMQSRLNHLRTVDRQAYLDIIFKKTAILIGTSCGVGALSVGATSEDVALMRQVGICLGMAFQIQDDILDYAADARTGKPACADLAEGKITLPLLSVLENCDSQERDRMMSLLDSVNKEPQNIPMLRSLVEERGGLTMATRVMNDYLDQARSIIDTLPDNEFRASLLLLTDYVGRRQK